MLGFVPLSSLSISDASSSFPIALQSSLTVTTNVTPALVLDQPLASAVSVTASTAANLVLVNQLDQNLTATAAASGTALLAHSPAANVTAEVTASPLLIQSQEVTAAVSVELNTSPLLVLYQELSTAVDVSASITGTLGLVKQLDQNLTATATTTALIDLVKQLDQNLTATANTQPNLTLENNSSALVFATATASPLLVLGQEVSAAVDVTAISEPENISVVKNLAASIDASITLLSFSNLDNSLQSDLLLEHDVTGEISLNKNLESSLSVTTVVTGLLSVNKQLSQNLSATATTTAAIAHTTALFADITATVNKQSDLTVVIDVISSVDVSAQTTAQISLVKNLSAAISTEASATTVVQINSSVSVTALCAALLDVDNNTDGSPGGFETIGFYPKSSVVLTQHTESAAAATYTITADFGPGVETEIMEVSFNDNPASVLSYLVSGNQAFITANTPADVYAQASTFIVNRELVPVYNTAYNYKVRFNTAVKKDNSGNNFYSGKFYSEGNAICFLSDDGRGIVDLYEELYPGTTVKLKSVGRIDYATGYVEVEQLVITNKYDPTLLFFVESLDAVIPTQDYFAEQNNLLVQSKTLTFPTGEQVEISQYEKQTDIVDLEIYVTARSYLAVSPLVTIEERTATYVLRIVPDYDIGKTALLQLLAEQAA